MTSLLGDAGRELASAEGDYEDATKRISRLRNELEQALQNQKYAYNRMEKAKRVLIYQATEVPND